MSKFINNKNLLRDLVLTGSEREYGKDTVKGLLRSLLEPLTEQTSREGLVLMRLFDTDGVSSVLKRLMFSDVKMYSFSDESSDEKIINIQKENIWDTTEFVLILAPRYSAVILWDWEINGNGTSQICLILNSREISDVANIMFSNAAVPLDNYLVTYAPDRREQKTMNIALNKIVDCLNSVNHEMMITKAEQNNLSETEDVLRKFENISDKAKMTAHEIKNHISVIDLYSKILEKRLDDVSASEETLKSIQNGIKSIRQASYAIASFIGDLRAYTKPILTEKMLSSVVASAAELALPKIKEKNIEFDCYVSDEYRVHIDEGRIRSVLINLLYNAADAIVKNGRITIKTGLKINNKISLLIKDSGCGIPVENIDKIFDEGFTTKIDGNGLGLAICKKMMQEQYGELNLVRTGSDGTEFEVLIPTV